MMLPMSYFSCLVGLYSLTIFNNAIQMNNLHPYSVVPLIIYIFRGIMKLDARARQDVAFLGSEFLKLDGKHFFATYWGSK